MANTVYGQDGFLVIGASANQGPFPLLGGKYGITFQAGVAGTTAGLSVLGPDGVNYVPVPAATFNAAVVGFATVDLPSGVYQVTVGGATGVNMSVTPILTSRK